MDNTGLAIVAGEVSGDRQSAGLVRAIKKLSPGIDIWGIGGPQMEAEGVELIYDITQWSVIGFWEVLKNFKALRKIFYNMLDIIKERRPKAVILVDYPGFNLRLAKKIKALNIPIIYYISPQVWAWGRRRIKQIKGLVDKMIVIFPFEKKLYENAGVPVEFVGHPIIDIVENRISRREQFRKKLGLGFSDKLVGILPGSREQEVKRLLPLFLESAKIMEGSKFVIAGASKKITKLISGYTQSIPIFYGSTYDIMEASDLILTSSGTATLETACFSTPMVVVYRLNWLTYFIVKQMISIPNIAMANIVAGRHIVPELVQGQAVPSAISMEALSILESPERQNEIKKGLQDVRARLGGTGAFSRAARIVCDMIEKKD